MKNILMALTAILLWASVPTVSGLIDYDTNYFTITLGMFLFALIAFGIKTFTTKKEFVNKIKEFNKKDYYKIAFAGIFITCYYLSYYYALSKAPKIEVTLINYLWPALNIVFATLIFKTKQANFTFFDLVKVGLSFFGLFIIVNNNMFNFTNIFAEFNIGYLFALLAGFSAAIYTNFILLANTKIQSIYHTYFLTLCFAIPLLFLSSWILSINIILTWGVFAIISYLGLIVFFVGQSLWLSALNASQKITSISLLAYITPIIASLFLYLFLKQTLTLSTIIGGSIIITVNFLTLFKFNKKKSRWKF